MTFLNHDNKASALHMGTLLSRRDRQQRARVKTSALSMVVHLLVPETPNCHDTRSAE